jgi:hypothetical protein
MGKFKYPCLLKFIGGDTLVLFINETDGLCLNHHQNKKMNNRWVNTWASVSSWRRPSQQTINRIMTKNKEVMLSNLKLK